MDTPHKAEGFKRSLSRFGDFVLDHEDLDEILNEACRLIAEGLGVDLAKVIEIDHISETALVGGNRLATRNSRP